MVISSRGKDEGMTTRHKGENGQGHRRGRPPKFGRPARVVAMTLPEDVLEKLEALHADPAWAIVELVESSFGNGPRGRGRRRADAVAAAQPVELVRLSGRRALIVVEPRLFARLRGVSTLPLADGRAFLALDHPGGIADLELAVLDRLEELRGRSAERARLERARAALRQWRRTSRLTFRSKSIIVVEGALAEADRPLPKLGRTTRAR
jgi:hypothetical protein